MSAPLEQAIECKEPAQAAARSLSIPKVAHFAWIGGPLPRMVADNVARFKELHPAWDTRVWIGVPDGMPPDLLEAIYSAKELCMRSDIIRAWLLFEFGGVYLDTDVYMLRPLDKLLQADHFVARRLHGTLNNAVMGSVSRSDLFSRIIADIRSKHKEAGPWACRHDYGPNLLARIRDLEPQRLNILPAHYFYIFQTHETAIKFIGDTPANQAATMQAVRSRIMDAEEPFAIHTWGIPKEAMPSFQPGRSSWMKPMHFGDALLRRLGNRPARATVLNITNCRLLAYLLGHQSSLHLTMVREPAGGSTDAIWPVALEATEFARERRLLLEGVTVEAAGKFPDRSLDCILWGSVAPAADDLPKLEAWVTKLKAGAFLCGYDIHLDGPETVLAKLAGKAGGTFEIRPDKSWFITLPQARPEAAAVVKKPAVPVAQLLPDAKEVPFIEYNGKYAGQTCFVIGRGPTDIWHEDLTAR